MPIMPPQDDRDDLDCQESLEVEFQAHVGVALMRLLDDAAEARRAIIRLVDVHLTTGPEA